MKGRARKQKREAPPVAVALERQPGREMYALLCGGLVVAALSFILRPFEIRDADVFWHLATGRWILAHHAIPRTDPFSHTSAGVPWADHEWLFQVVLRFVQLALGMTGLFALKCLLYTAAVVQPMLFAWRRGVPGAAIVAAGGIALWAALPFSEYRPLMVSLVLFTLVIEGARRWREQPLLRLGAGLAGLFVLWANVHATFVLGLVALVCTAFERGGDKVALPDAAAARRRLTPKSPAGRVALARNSAMWLACAAATLVNPYGWRVWEVPLKVGASPLFMSANQEWRPPDLSVEFWGFYVLAAAVALVVVGRVAARSAQSRATTSWGEVVLCLLLGVASAKSRRIIPWFAVASIPVVAAGLQDLYARRRLALRVTMIPAVFCSLLILVSADSPWAEPPGTTNNVSDGLAFPSDLYPEGCVRVLRSAGAGGNLFNDYNHGGFLHYYAGPEWKVFVDGRNDLHGEAVTLRYNRIALAGSDWKKELDEAKVNAAIISYRMAIERPNVALALESQGGEWAVAGFDDAGILFARRSAVDSAWLEANEYRLVRPMRMYEEVIDGLRSTGTLEEFVSELRRRCAQGRSRMAEQLLARGLIDTGRKSEAREVLARETACFGADAMSGEIEAALRAPR